MDQPQGTARTKAQGQKGMLRAISRAPGGATTRLPTGEGDRGRTLGRARPPLLYELERSDALLCTNRK